VVLSLVLLFVISVVIFLVLRVLPGDPVLARLGGTKFIDESAIEALRASMGLDQALPIQYVQWISGVASGDFGESYSNGYPVAQLIGQRLFPTVELAVAGLMIAVIVATGFSLLSVAARRRFVKGVVEGYTVFGLSAPPFVIGIILILVVPTMLSGIPVGGYVDPADDPLGNLLALLLPALTLGIAVSAPLIRYLMGSMDEVQGSLFVRTARGKGLSRGRIVTRHVFPNGVLPALTAFGVSVGVLLGGVVEIEYIFSWPGLGSLLVEAVFARDYALIQTIVLLAAALVIACNLVVDLLYGVLDPRLRIRIPRVAPNAREA
jgi:peptide/nickel transport system permease protein